MTAYYNENDPYAAQWLRNLIAAGQIAAGDVDERSIQDVSADDLRGFTQAHFFAGIGGWSVALRLAGWTDDRAVWSGSCPCQPLSSAGQRKGHDDERHLWPAFFGLIAKRKPAIIFGEQVAGADGREWLAGVRADLESLGHACGAADLCSAGVGAPTIRQRLYWMAYADSAGQYGRPPSRQQPICNEIAARHEGMGNTTGPGPQEQRREYRPGGERCSGLVGFAIETGVPQWNGPTIAVECSDGYRRVSAQPDAFPLAHGVRARMGKLRGAGNAINPKLAAEFIKAADEAMTVRPMTTAQGTKP